MALRHTVFQPFKNFYGVGTFCPSINGGLRDKGQSRKDVADKADVGVDLKPRGVLASFKDHGQNFTYLWNCSFANIKNSVKKGAILLTTKVLPSVPSPSLDRRRTGCHLFGGLTDSLLAAQYQGHRFGSCQSPRGTVWPRLIRDGPGSLDRSASHCVAGGGV